MKEKCLAHLLLNARNKPFCLVDAAGNVQAMNAPAEEMTGYREDELVGRPFPVIPKSVGDFSDLFFQSVLAPNGRWIGVMIRRKDETEVDAICKGYTLGESGILLELGRGEVSAEQDEGLYEIKSNLSSIFEGMADGLVLIDEAGKILLFSRGAERLFGFRAAEVLGSNVRVLMPSPYHEEHDGYLAAYRETGVRKIIGIGREVSGKRKDGSIFPMYLSVGEIWIEGRRYFVGVTHDLTRAKMLEGRLWMLSAAVEQSPVAVMIANKSGLIEYVNTRFTQLTGYSESEVLGKNPRLLQSNTPRRQYKQLWETIESGGEWQGEILDRKKNGELYWAFEIITPLRNEQGDIIHYLALQEDVTERRRDKEALALSEERFRKVAEMVGEWLWEQDAEGHYIYSSNAVRDILGLSPAEIVGKSYLDLLAEDSADNQRHKPSSRPFYRVTNCYRRLDGTRVYTESSGAPIFDSNGHLVKWRGVDRDITARKDFEDALRVRNRAIDAVRVGIVISDALRPGCPNIYVNSALSNITGFDEEELLQGGLRVLEGFGRDTEEAARIQRTLAKGQSCEITLESSRKNGDLFWNEIFVSPVPDDSGRITHYISVQTDVTEKRRAEQNRRDLEIAKQIQLSLLPRAALQATNIEVIGACVPAAHVGGDYFDYFENGGAIYLVIADVSGHNVGAALIMTEVRSMVRARCRQAASAQPNDILQDLNDLLHEDLTRSELFITMFCCRFEPKTRKLRFANGGHNPALLLRVAQSDCTPLDADGIVLGARWGVDFEGKAILLSPGDKLLFYTDGITEAQDASGQFFGIERLCRIFKANRRLEPEAIMEALLEDVRVFSGRAELDDDVAIVVVKIR